MPNFFIVNKPSNLILNVVVFKSSPADSKDHKFIPAKDKAIAILDKWMIKNPGLMMDIGDLMSRSPYIADYVSAKRKHSAMPQRQYYREEQFEKTADRLSAICMWITEHPDADEHDLNEVFNTGTVAAKAYLLNYRA